MCYLLLPPSPPLSTAYLKSVPKYLSPLCTGWVGRGSSPALQFLIPVSSVVKVLFATCCHCTLLGFILVITLLHTVEDQGVQLLRSDLHRRIQLGITFGLSPRNGFGSCKGLEPSRGASCSKEQVASVLETQHPSFLSSSCCGLPMNCCTDFTNTDELQYT